MARALDLAWRGWGRAQPNPLVGAVVLAGTDVAGEGWHAEFGGLHAETAALAAAGPRARGATMVVTLEPCAHQGKQPPCTDALIAAGIARVVAAVVDPDPRAGGGGERLRAAGIAVEFGLLGDRACAQNRAFLHRHRVPGRPFVALKLATSADARIADTTGRSRWLSGPAARAYVHWLRAGFDAIAVGAGTVAADDPQLTVRGEVRPRIPPRRVIFDRSLRAPLTARLVTGAREVPTTIVTRPGGAATSRGKGLASAGVTLLEAADPASALAELGRSGVSSLLVEGGGRLAATLLGAGLVDRFYWVQTPLFLGEGAVPAFPGLGAGHLPELERWQVVERRALDADTLLVLDREPCLPAS